MIGFVFTSTGFDAVEIDPTRIAQSAAYPYPDFACFKFSLLNDIFLCRGSKHFPLAGGVAIIFHAIKFFDYYKYSTN